MEFDFPYTAMELTQEVNRVPNTYGLLNALGIAPVETKSSRFVRIDYRNGQVVVLSAEEPGSPGQVTDNDEEGGVIIEIPHFPHLDSIHPQDIQDIQAVVGGQMQMNSLDSEVVKRLMSMRMKHGITLEYIRLGMIKGLIKDGKGRTLYDLFSLNGVTKKVVNFSLGTTTTDVMAKCEEVRDHIFENAKGETVGRVEMIVESAGFSRLINHSKVEKFWLAAQNDSFHQDLRREYQGNNWGRIFEFGDILFREYKGSMPVKNSSGAIVSEPNVASQKGHAYPSGTQDMFRTYEGPVHHIAYANRDPETEGQDFIFVSEKVLDHGAGVELKSQTNRVAICKQPECLVEATL